MMQIYDLAIPRTRIHPELRVAGAGAGRQGSDAGRASTARSRPGKGNRVYLGIRHPQGGVIEIVDREKLLKGPKEPTDENLRYPVIARSSISA